jgi:hypothetical protein
VKDGEWTIAMTSLAITLAVFTSGIIMMQATFWLLFERKMEPLRFPARAGGTGPHVFWLLRLRLGAIGHTIMLIVFVWIFCIVLW